VTVEVVVLALTASMFTALASVAQRRAAAPAPGELSFSWRLATYLVHRPVWFLGIASMILGFVFQVAALRLGSLSLVQPLIATELVLVFAMIALHDRRRVQGRDWLSALGMVLGLGLFLSLARPSRGHAHAATSLWIVSALATFALAGVLAAVAFLPRRGGARATSGRKAALLGIAAAIGFGFVAAVVKELSVHIAQGPAAVFSNWSPYALVASGAASMFLASNAFQAGSLAASQPGLTVVDPVVASVLGVVLFGERIDLHAGALLGELLGLALVIGSVIVLSGSPLVQDAPAGLPDAAPPDGPEPASARVPVPAPAERHRSRRRTVAGDRPVRLGRRLVPLHHGGASARGGFVPRSDRTVRGHEVPRRTAVAAPAPPNPLAAPAPPNPLSTPAPLAPPSPTARPVSVGAPRE
jgi:drug/metabolite transporter (DMT)-like permease